MTAVILGRNSEASGATGQDPGWATTANKGTDSKGIVYNMMVHP